MKKRIRRRRCENCQQKIQSEKVVKKKRGTGATSQDLNMSVVSV